eukprot:TRINITY_DN3306_c0_g1_i1.p1 TRINITY_DN3306_c0_g1~~TRINITY_DN3306_c0_g1_i1.p1  ORF type:complete len:251 (-),score=60.08 TRINITY_DN3306_c0_g1_i1:335-1087(-)
MGSEEDSYEHTLLIKKECFVYRIPPRPSAAGYKAQDWDPSKFIWSGRLVITAKGDACTIKLESPETNDVFATCPVDPTAVEPVVDSSRYFVLKISDGQGRHAFIGMGFTERSDAFDFNAAIQDHLKHVQTKAERAKAAERLASEPKVDYSLKAGQTIHVTLGGAPPGGASKPRPKTSDGGGSGGLLLPPPPSGPQRGHRGISQSQPTSGFQQPTQPQPQQDEWSAFRSAPSQSPASSSGGSAFSGWDPFK